MANELIELVADLLGSKKKRKKFDRDPEKMMKKYGLQKEACDCLYTMNHKKVGELIAAELYEFAFEKGEFPTCEHDGKIFAEAFYPTPEPRIFDIVPAEVASEEQVDVVVWGQSFPPGKRLELELEPTKGAQTLEFTQKIEGTYRCCQIHARLKQPQPGVYKLRVKSRIGYLPPDGEFTLTVT